MVYTKPIDMNKDGFTLVELLVAILILGILAGIGVPALMNRVKQASMNTTTTNLRLVEQALDLYKSDIGSYPKRLDVLIERPSGQDAKKWQGPYFKKKLPLDGWKREFYYKVTPQGKHPYELYSYGPEGEAADAEERISAWDI